MHAVLPFPDIHPEIVSVELFGLTFALRWYALAYIAGILIGWALVRRALARPSLWGEAGAPMDARQLEDLVTWVILGIILGGRLGFVLFYNPGYFLSDPAAILRIWEGGMSFHGGLAGVILAALAFCFRRGISPWSVGDLLAMVAPIGLLLGRLANFINAELWGRPTTLPWGVIFPGPAAQNCAGFPAAVAAEPAGLCARHPSQLYEAGLEGLLLGLVLLVMVRAGALKRPGLVTGVFFAGYALARILVETVRQPDAQFTSPDNPLGYAWQLGEAGLTMGQILSLPMLAFGLYAILRARRQATP